MKESKQRPISTAPNLSAENEISELKAEIETLKSMLQTHSELDKKENTLWPSKIDYYNQPYSGSKLTGLTKDRNKIGSTEKHPELPKPTKNIS